MPLLCLLIALWGMRKELAAMRRPNYVRRKSDGRTGEATAPNFGHPRDPDGRHRIIVRWDDDGTVSGWEAVRDFETLSFEAHFAARFGAP
jgi:hypothetical protein